MTAKEELTKKIQQRKKDREREINQIPLPHLRRNYQQKLGSDEKMQEFFAEATAPMFRYFNNRLMIPVLHLLYSRSMPWIFKKQFHLKSKPREFFDSIADYCMFATSYGAWPMEIDEVSEERVVAYFDVCPGGCEENPGLCRAITSMEPRLSKKSYFGATVTYTERIPDGAPRCKVVFEKK